MTDDIVTRLRHKYAGQLPICAEAADEIERLREQVALAHAILGSEPMIWLAGGTSNHEMAHWDALMPAIQKYWKKHGNVFRSATDD